MYFILDLLPGVQLEYFIKTLFIETSLSQAEVRSMQPDMNLWPIYIYYTLPFSLHAEYVKLITASPDISSSEPSVQTF